MSIINRYNILVTFLLCFFGGNAQTGFAQKIDKLLEIYNVNDTPGLSVKVIKQGKAIYSKGYGLSNLDYNIKNSDSTVFGLASIAKQFTAAAIWALAEEGKINLEDDIRMYLPEFPKYDEIIKIKHLLNHTSGIRNYHTLMYLSGFDYNQHYYDNQTILELACRQKDLNILPNKKVMYSNTNYNLLAIIVEKISGQNLDAYLKTKILVPLAMNDTYVKVENGKTVKNKAVGYQKDEYGFIYNESNQLSYGAGSMGSTVNDMTKWIEMLNGQITEFLELSKFLKTVEVLSSSKKASYARGLMVDEYKGKTTLSHSGFGFGGRTHLITVPVENIGIIVLSNLQSINATTIAYQILDILLPKNKTETIEKSKKLIFKKQLVKNFTGDYKEINSDMKMSIFIENDTLKSKGSLGKNANTLVQFDKNKFHRRDSQNVKYDFTKSEEYDMIISFSGTPFYFKRAQFITEDEVNINDYTGNFYSEELDVNYNFSNKNNQLQLSYKNIENIRLHPIQLDEFGNKDRTLYHFVKNEENKVTRMLLSCDGTVKDIVFKKVDVTN